MTDPNVIDLIKILIITLPAIITAWRCRPSDKQPSSGMEKEQ